MSIIRDQIRNAKDVMSVVAFFGTIVRICGNKKIPFYITSIKRPITMAYLGSELFFSEKPMPPAKKISMIAGVTFMGVAGIKRIVGRSFGDYEPAWQLLNQGQREITFALITWAAFKKVRKANQQYLEANTAQETKAAVVEYRDRVIALFKKGLKLFGRSLKMLDATEGMQLSVKFLEDGLGFARVGFKRWAAA